MREELTDLQQGDLRDGFPQFSVPRLASIEQAARMQRKLKRVPPTRQAEVSS